MRITSATGSLALIALAIAVVLAAAPAFAEVRSGVDVGDRDIGVGSHVVSEGPHQRALLHSGTAGPADTTGHTGHKSFTWLKWVAAAVLTLEGLVGIALPAVLRMTLEVTWLISLLNTFAGGVFLTFGIMHILPDVIKSQEELGFTRFPIAPFIVMIGFFSFLFLQKVLAPALKLGHSRFDTSHANSAEKAMEFDTVDVETPAEPTTKGVCQCGTPAPESSKDCEGGTSLLVEGCGCQGNCSGSCNSQCSPDKCPCVVAKAATARGVVSSSQAQFLASSGGTAVAIPAAATAIAHRGCFSWAMLSPGLVMIGVLLHAVLEGLAIGLQTSYANVLTAFVAMASHKWVESIAISAHFIKAEASTWAILAYLVPFSLGPLVGISIGVSVSNSSNWAELVLFSLISGLFIYIGTCEITAEEFVALERPGGLDGKPRGARFWLFGALFFGFTVVALLQLVPES